MTINQRNLFDYYANCIEDLPFYFEHRTSVYSKVIILLCCSSRYKRHLYCDSNVSAAGWCHRFSSIRLVSWFRTSSSLSSSVEFKAKHSSVFADMYFDSKMTIGKTLALITFKIFVSWIDSDIKKTDEKEWNKSCCDAIWEHMNAIDLRRKKFNRHQK